MYETLTPRENLTFAAAFILPKVSKENRSKEVDEEIGQHNFCVGISIWHGITRTNPTCLIGRHYSLQLNQTKPICVESCYNCKANI